MSHDPSKCIEKPLAALVQRPNGKERVRMRPPVVAIADNVWNEAIDEGAGIHVAMFRELRKNGLIREAVVRNMDH